MNQAHAQSATGRSGKPWHLPGADWITILKRSWAEQSDDTIGLVAAGVAFYGFLALVPLLGAVVLSYGLVASPETVLRNVQHLASVMPGDSAKLVGEQLMHVVQTSGGKKGVGLLLALAIALFGARSAAGALITALNIAYEEQERRGFIRVNLLALGLTAGAVLFAVVAAVAIAALGHLEKLLPGAPGALIVLGKLLTYLVLAGAGAAVAATLYLYGPSRENARWEWLTPGSLFTTLGWLVLTFGFGLYVKSFGNYNATYGSLSAVIVLLTWLYLSSYVFLFGAELNSELERLIAGEAPAAADKATADRAVRPAPIIVTPAPIHPAPAAPSHRADWLAAGAASRIAPVLGGRKAGMIPASLAALGIGFLRRQGKEVTGLALVGAAAGLALLGRPRAKPADPQLGQPLR